ncbi:MAG: DNA repair protein RadA [bacterium]|nr:DNA repair protein RadA [bacterium]
MAKPKTAFVCQSCGTTHVRWQGRCPDCGEWNSIVEETVIDPGKHARPSILDNAAPMPITARDHIPPERIDTGLPECDRVLGGGLVPGSLTLIGGDPGIGKSTLMLQVGHALAERRGPVLYVSGEESFDQARLRARRLGTLSDNLLVLTETSVDAVRKRFDEGDFALVVVDSIQSVYSPDLSAVPGSVGQVRECANEFLRLAKGSNVPTILVGHVTKEGAIAGPRLLEHLVDTVLYFEGDDMQALRILRSVKNRFGSTNEIGVFEMTDAGLREVPNPSALFLDERPKGVSGSIVIPSVEGTRPVLVEVQALVSDSHLGSPRRTVTGVNANRVSLILAVLEKRAGAHFSDKDVFVNVAGGLRLEEPAADLAIAVALVSSLLEAPLSPSLAVFGEVGLAGEIRAVNMARQRLAEACNFGFTTCVLPKSCAGDSVDGRVSVLPVSGIRQAVDLALER